MKKLKRIALYDPYLDVMGGGERHILEIIKLYDEYGWQIDILWNKKNILSEIEDKLNITFNNVRVVPNFLEKKGFLRKILKTKEYDSLFYVTDGSYFFSLAKNNYVFCMYPQKSIYKNTILNKIKWLNWEFIVNSNYTKLFIDKFVGKTSKVIYPYFEIIKDGFKKEKLIISVGRFFRGLHSKRHDVLIEAFEKLAEERKEFKEFKLVLIGGLKEEDREYYEELKKVVKDNINISFELNISHKKLVDYYRRSMYYWHAAGFGIDTEKNPEAVEHLGITPLEAMNYEALVFAYNAGGPKEMIIDDVNGYLFNTVDELVEKTANSYKQKVNSQKIINNSKIFLKEKFSYLIFKEKVLGILNL